MILQVLAKNNGDNGEKDCGGGDDDDDDGGGGGGAGAGAGAGAGGGGGGGGGVDDEDEKMKRWILSWNCLPTTWKWQPIKPYQNPVEW